MSPDIGHETFNFVVMEVIWGCILGHSEVEWPPTNLKCWQANHWSPHPSPDTSLDTGHETLIFMVIWGHIFIARSNDLQLFRNADRSTTAVVIIHLMCRPTQAMLWSSVSDADPVGFCIRIQFDPHHLAGSGSASKWSGFKTLLYEAFMKHL